jgi:acyl carrier protein
LNINKPVIAAICFKKLRKIANDRIFGAVNDFGRIFMTLEEKVIKIVMEQLDVTQEECVLEASFIDDLGADSLDIVELLMEMEEAFDIEIADEELEKIATIQDVVDFLRQKGVQ